MRNLMTEIFVEGERVYKCPSLKEVAAFAKERRAEFWEEYTRLVNPHKYKVDLSNELYDLKKQLTYLSARERG